MNKREKIVEKVAEHLIGRLPIHAGPFISQAEARRCANHDNQKRFDLAEEIADATMEMDEAEARERYEEARKNMKLWLGHLGTLDRNEVIELIKIASGYKPKK